MPATFLGQLLQRPPARLARYPELPLARALAEWHRIEAAPAPPEPPPPREELPAPGGALDDETLAQLATHLWRARRRLEAPDAESDPSVPRRAARHVEAAADALARAHLVTKDWIHEPYDPGLPLRVLAFQPAPGITRDTITEVVRPAVFLRDRLLQPAEVVVGTPAPA
jgi:hypothetical protein